MYELAFSCKLRAGSRQDDAWHSTLLLFYVNFIQTIMDEETQLAMALSISMVNSDGQQRAIPNSPPNQPQAQGNVKKKGRRKKKKE